LLPPTAARTTSQSPSAPFKSKRPMLLT
jgi:hypothetical protein